MPALVESGGESRRPRRPSITKQLQRMLHIDQTADVKSGSEEGSSIADYLTTTPQQLSHSIRPAAKDNFSGEYANHGLSDISSNGHSRRSYSSLSSKVTGLNIESRHSSLQSLHLEPQQSALSPKHDADGTVTTSHSVVQKKDRRATKRLEAERLNLEKRMLKLEEAERTGDAAVLRRESRRLTKKQPLGSSSRSSSMSGDESRSRPPSRLSSLFSSARRRSRSRSSSIDGVDNTQYFGSDEAPPNDTQNTLPSLSSTLPERLSTAISKELAARKNALLASPEVSTQSLELSKSHSQSITQNEDAVSLGAVVPMSSEGRRERTNSETSLEDAHQQTDLDRALFTANLTSKKRSVTSSGTVSQTMHPSKPRVSSLPEAHAPTEADRAGIDSKSRSTAVPRGSPLNMMTRTSADGVVQRQHKKFKSSPLAESQTINCDDAPPSSRKATTLASPRTPDAIRRSRALENGPRSEPNVASSPSVGIKNPRSFMSKIPTSRPSQSAPSGLLMKPRFYNSLNKVTGRLSGSRLDSNTTLSPTLPQERAPSPSVPPRSPKRNSRAISQSPEPTSSSDHRLRPTSNLSNLSTEPTPESESDYNTADEAASVISNASDGEDCRIPAKARASNNKLYTASKKDASSSTLNSAVAPFNPKAEPKQVKRRQPGRDQFVGKLFVICCRCKFWHDLPSEVYASLTKSDPLSAALDEELAAWERNALSERLGSRPLHESSVNSLPTSELKQRSLRTRMTVGLPSGPVNCCWCEHKISKQCCQGWTTVVQMRQRHH
ncbi:hypothetical protein BJX99DRAFT_235501 [Aspergillus californicus]